MIKSPCEVAFHRTPFLSTFFSFCFEYLFVIDFEQFDYDMFCAVFFSFFFFVLGLIEVLGSVGLQFSSNYKSWGINFFKYISCPLIPLSDFKHTLLVCLKLFLTIPMLCSYYYCYYYYLFLFAFYFGYFVLVCL